MLLKITQYTSSFDAVMLRCITREGNFTVTYVQRTERAILPHCWDLNSYKIRCQHQQQQKQQQEQQQQQLTDVLVLVLLCI